MNFAQRLKSDPRPVITYVECKEYRARTSDGTCTCGAPLLKHALSALKGYMRANVIQASEAS